MAGPVLLSFAGSEQELGGLAGWVVKIVDSLGPVGVGLLIAAENLLPPIPSEVILPVAGFVASQGRMNVVAAIIAATLGSLAGALALYALGAWLGEERLRRLVARTPLVSADDLDRAGSWFERRGGTAVLVGRCVPVVRSLISVPAGVARMPLRTFLPYTLIGSGVWNSIFVVAGYQLGASWENVGRYSGALNNIVLAIFAAMIIWFVVNRMRSRRG